MLMEIPKIEDAKRTPEVNQLLDFIEQLLLKLREQVEMIEILKEEIIQSVICISIEQGRIRLDYLATLAIM